jgi:hypothetical protein
MDATAPPSKSEARRQTGRREKLTSERNYRLHRVSQVALAVWRQEAARLHSEHRRTGDSRHLRAFHRHCGGMGGRLGRGGTRCML